MTLRLNATLVVADISYHIEADSVAGLTAAVTELKAGSSPTKDAAAPAPAPTKETKAPAKGKSAEAEKPAASSPPATPVTASASTSPSPDPKPQAAPAAQTDYLKTALPAKIAAYLGDKEAEGYADRRTKLVALLTSFNVKKGPELKPEQFADFEAAIDKLSAPAEEDLG